jgi:hypothetical protein
MFFLTELKGKGSARAQLGNLPLDLASERASLAATAQLALACSLIQVPRNGLRIIWLLRAFELRGQASEGGLLPARLYLLVDRLHKGA